MLVTITTIAVLVLLALLLSLTEGEARHDNSDKPSMTWAIKDLDEHYLSWNNFDDSLRVYSAWKEMKKNKTSFSWDNESVLRTCETRQTVNNVTTCNLNIPHRNGNKLTLRLCQRRTKCRLFRIEGAVFVDVKYSTNLSSMNVTREILSANSVKLFIDFPKAVCEYDDVKYAYSSRRYNEKDRTCDLAGLNKDTFYKANKHEVCSGIDKTIHNLKSNTTLCVVLQYEVVYRGQPIHGDVFYKTVTTDPDVNVYFLRYGFMIVSFLLVVITAAVIKFFIKPKYKKLVIRAKSKNEKILQNITSMLDNNSAHISDSPLLVVEKYDEIDCKTAREESCHLADDEDKNISSTSISIGSQETFRLIGDQDHSGDEDDSKSSSRPPSYVELTSQQSESGYIEKPTLSTDFS